jgi:hypothetical protein
MRGGDAGALLFVYGTLRAASGHAMHRGFAPSPI